MTCSPITDRLVNEMRVVPLTEAVIASFERLARGEPTEDLVKALVAEVRRLRAEVERLTPRSRR
jgi:hypothetical protein